jgi:hypothetical protein
VIQQGQVFKLKARGTDGRPLWAYRHRLDGRGVGAVASRGFLAAARRPRKRFGRRSRDFDRAGVQRR